MLFQCWNYYYPQPQPATKAKFYNMIKHNKIFKLNQCQTIKSKIILTLIGKSGLENLSIRFKGIGPVICFLDISNSLQCLSELMFLDTKKLQPKLFQDCNSARRPTIIEKRFELRKRTFAFDSEAFEIKSYLSIWIFLSSLVCVELCSSHYQNF